MIRKVQLFFVFVLFGYLAVVQQIQSPNGRLGHTFELKKGVPYYSLPLQMAACLPVNDMRFAVAFQFVKDVAVDWDDLRALAAEPDDYITIARKAKGTNNWFAGTTIDENGYLPNLKFDFLDEGKQYLGTICADAPDANYKTNSQAYTISRLLVTNKSVLKQKCAPDGSYAIRVIEITDKVQAKGTKKI